MVSRRNRGFYFGWKRISTLDGYYCNSRVVIAEIITVLIEMLGLVTLCVLRILIGPEFVAFVIQSLWKRL